LFSEILGASRALLDSGQPLLISVDARAEGEDAVRITAQSIELLDEAAASISSGLQIVIQDETALQPLHQLLAKEHGGPGRGGRLHLLLPTADRQVEIALPGSYGLGPPLRAAIKAIQGVADLRDF